MLLPATLAAALLAAAPAQDPGTGPIGDATLRPGPPGLRRLDPGPFRGRELLGSAGGIVVGDLLVLGAAVGTFHLFTSGSVDATAGNFRNAAVALGVVTLLAPPLGAALGGHLARAGPARGALWKAFLLALAGQAAALATGYLAAPQYWAILPVQLATMSMGASLGLHWGGRAGRAREEAAEPRDAPEPAAPLALAPAICEG